MAFPGFCYYLHIQISLWFYSRTNEFDFPLIDIKPLYLLLPFIINNFLFNMLISLWYLWYLIWLRRFYYWNYDVLINKGDSCFLLESCSPTHLLIWHLRKSALSITIIWVFLTLLEVPKSFPIGMVNLILWLLILLNDS